MSKGRNYHIVPSPGGGWSVRRAGANRASGVFSRQSEAVQYGRQLARGSHSELVVHGKDGRIRNGMASGHDPYPPKYLPKGLSTTLPKGFGSLRGKLVVRRGIDLTKPIFQQTTRETKKGSAGDRTK